jgi:hypothetical protein
MMPFWEGLFWMGVSEKKLKAIEAESSKLKAREAQS